MAKPSMITDRSHAARWQHPSLFQKGYVATPITFLEHYATLPRNGGMTPTEAMLVLQIMSYKWSDSAPFPSYATLAKRMGVSTKTVQRQVKALEDRGFLVRKNRRGRSNAFDLVPLFDLLDQVVSTSESHSSQAA